jgi:hypothetical protein
MLSLLVVVAIILLLTTLYWGSSSGQRQRQRLLACRTNLEKLYISLDIFARDHNGSFPSAPAGARTSEEALDALVPRYNSDTSLFICPASKDAPLSGGQPLVKGRISYAYYAGHSQRDNQDPLMSDRQIDTLAKSAGQPVFSSDGKPPGNNHRADGGYFLLCDGHVERSPCISPISLLLTQGVVLLNPKP